MRVFERLASGSLFKKPYLYKLFFFFIHVPFFSSLQIKKKKNPPYNTQIKKEGKKRYVLRTEHTTICRAS
jgi:hypothetical protein